MKVKEVIDKLSSYNLYNYLFPGFIFVIALDKTTSLIPDNVELSFIIVIAVVYFSGLFISRIGSLVIEEILLASKSIKPLPTRDLIARLREDIKLEVIYEAMNMYRTLGAMSVILFIVTIIDLIKNNIIVNVTIVTLILEFIFSVLFIFAFRKQRGKVQKCLDTSAS